MHFVRKEQKGKCCMTTTTSTAEARKIFANLVNKVASGKEPAVLTRRGQEVATLVSVEEFRLLQELEDRIDIENAIRALDVPGEEFGGQPTSSFASRKNSSSPRHSGNIYRNA